MRPELAIAGGTATIAPDRYGTWPDIHEEDRQAVLSVLERGVLTGGGAVEAPGLERDYATYTGARHCLAFNAGTAALHACAVASGLEPGDEAIVPAFTYVASAMAMAHHGVRPVFADVELDTFLLDPAGVEARVTPRTKALVAVHLHGMPCDMEALDRVARRHGLVVIEDFAQAHGATFHGRMVGTFGHCAGGSLNATKNLPAGEGGLFLTDDDEALVAAQRLRYLGEDPIDVDPPLGRRYWAHGLGWNYRAQELPAAVARSQLKRLDGYNEVARRNAARLTEGLAGIPGIVPPREPEGRSSIWYIYRVRFDPEALGYEGPTADLRDRLVAALAAEGVRATLWQHHPLPAFSAFRRPRLAPWQSSLEGDLLPWNPMEFPVAQRICDETFVLGSGANPLAAQDAGLVELVVEAFTKVIDNLDELLAMKFERPLNSVAAAALNETAGRAGAPATLLSRS
jgi:perosamine synthetase